MAAMKVLNSNDKNFANEFGQLRTKLHLAGLLESAKDQLDVVLSIIR